VDAEYINITFGGTNTMSMNEKTQERYEEIIGELRTQMNKQNKIIQGLEREIQRLREKRNLLLDRLAKLEDERG